MVSSHGEQQDFQAAFEEGCNDYVARPVDAGELLAKVERLIGI